MRKKYIYDIDQLFTLGTWFVKEGKEKEFAKAWKSFADWSFENGFGSGTPYLLKDLNSHRSFISFGPWPDLATIGKWRRTKKFQTFVKKVKDLCEKFDPSALKVVAMGKVKK